jgi:serine O-acetyltransferase
MIKVYRIARWLYLHRVPFLPWALKGVNRILFGVVLPPSARLGQDVLLSYQGLGTVVHRNAVIGDRVTITSGVTIGGRSGHPVVPVILEGAFIGSGAKILGPVHIGRYASIGANAVVLEDIPDYAVAVGIPARVVRISRPEDIPDYRAFEKATD